MLLRSSFPARSVSNSRQRGQTFLTSAQRGGRSCPLPYPVIVGRRGLILARPCLAHHCLAHHCLVIRRWPLGRRSLVLRRAINPLVADGAILCFSFLRIHSAVPHVHDGGVTDQVHTEYFRARIGETETN